MAAKPAARKTQRLSIGLLFNGSDLSQEGIIAGIESFAVETGLNVYAFDSSVCVENAADDGVKNAFANLVNKRLLDGLLILAGAFPSPKGQAPHHAYKRFQPLPIVTIGFALPGSPHVMLDSRRGMEALVTHLARTHGRRRIALIAGPAGFPPADELVKQFESARKRLKLPARPRRIERGDGSPASGRSAAARLISGKKPSFDAILAANDAMAVGAMEELLRRSVRVPEQCALAAFQDDGIASSACLPLTTVRSSLWEAGWRAAELLVKSIWGEANDGSLTLDAELTVRESCGCLGDQSVPTFIPAARSSAAGRTHAVTAAAWLKAARADIAKHLPPPLALPGTAWATAVTGLLQSLRRFPRTLDTETFPAAWRALLTAVSGLRGDLEPWTRILGSLAIDTAARAKTPAARAKAAAMFRRASLETAERISRQTAFRKILLPRQVLLLRAVEHKLMTAPDLARIKKIIREDFPRLGITACLFSLRDGSASPLQYSSFVTGFDHGSPLACRSRRAQFITNRLLPAGLIDAKRRRTFVLETLHDRGAFRGHLLLESEKPDLAVFGVLRQGLEGALRHASRLDEIQGLKLNLETQLSDQTRDLLDLNQKWQSEKRATEKMKDELNRSEERYRRWFEEDFTANFIAAANGDIMNCNSAFARIFGFPSAAEALGANFGDFYPNKSALEDFYTLLGVVRRIEYYESEFVRKDGSILHIIGNIIGSFDEDGNLTEMQGFLFDNTERKRLEDELRHAHKMDAIGRLAGGIAHDFNNILTGIMGYSELLLNKIPKSDPSQKDVEEIKKAAKSAASLTRQLLAFSRKQILKPLLLDLNDVVQSMRDLLIRIIGEHISLVTELDPYLRPVKADRGQIEQVIMNLVINSRDALPHGGSIVLTTRNKLVESTGEFSTGTEIKPGPYVVLEVCDNGIGMDLETQSHIFEPFFSTKRIGQGVGLGLSTVYGIITQSGGFPEVASEPHRGTTMRIYLPQYTSAPEVREERIQYQEEVTGNETVLLVEDEDFVRDLAEKVLSHEGYHVIAAHNAQEALSLVKKHTLTFDLVVTDIVMPGMSGVELGQKIQALRPEIKVLLMSGYDDKMLSQQGESGVSMNFIQKPFTPELFLRKVQDTLNR